MINNLISQAMDSAARFLQPAAGFGRNALVDAACYRRRRQVEAP
jgi:hypothetical protein